MSESDYCGNIFFLFFQPLPFCQSKSMFVLFFSSIQSEKVHVLLLWIRIDFFVNFGFGSAHFYSDNQIQIKLLNPCETIILFLKILSITKFNGCKSQVGSRKKVMSSIRIWILYSDPINFRPDPIPSYF